MKTLAVFGLVFLTSGAVLAQHSPRVGFGNITFPSNTGFGSVVFPGTGRPPVSGSAFPVTQPGFPLALGNNIAGRPVPFGRQRGFGGGFGGGFSGGIGGGIVPYPYPVYMGGYGYPEAPQQPNVTVVYPPPSPPVILNQTFASDTGQQVARDYSQPAADAGVQVYQAPSRTTSDAAAAAAQSEAPYYLIALKDHSIYSAVGYWVSGDTLHYLTSGNTHNEVSLALVDRKLTDQLNRGRSMEVKLPSSR